MSGAEFEIVRTTAGWHARVRAGNGEIVWVTESYKRRRAAEDAISELVDLVTGDVVVDVEVDERDRPWPS